MGIGKGWIPFSLYFEGLVSSSCVSRQGLKARVLVWEVHMGPEPILKEGEGAVGRLTWRTGPQIPTIP